MTEIYKILFFGRIYELIKEYMNLGGKFVAVYKVFTNINIYSKWSEECWKQKFRLIVKLRIYLKG